MGLNHSCPRDLLGYGPETPDPQWPNQAKVAVQFVLNYEEGGENCVLYGDPHSESYLWEIVGAPGLAGVRNMNIESIYEYGSRSGVWRILALFREHRLPLTVYAVGMALERNPTVAARMLADGHEIATHGYRWIDYQYVGEETERAHLKKPLKYSNNSRGVDRSVATLGESVQTLVGSLRRKVDFFTTPMSTMTIFPTGNYTVKNLCF